MSGDWSRLLMERRALPILVSDAESLLAALERAMVLYNQPDTLRQMQRQAVLRIRQKHTWETVMKKYLKLYEKARLMRWPRMPKTERGYRLNRQGE